MDRFNDGIIDFSQFKKKKEEQEKEIKPLFEEPTIITLGSEEDESKEVKYMLLVNLVLDDKQYLALESMEKGEEGHVAVVEAIVQDDTFYGAKAIETQEKYEEVVGLMEEALNIQGGTEDDADNRGTSPDGQEKS
jgi:hypothetical protein